MVCPWLQYGESRASTPGAALTIFVYTLTTAITPLFNVWRLGAMVNASKWWPAHDDCDGDFLLLGGDWNHGISIVLNDFPFSWEWNVI
jgi:hypothetical protein